MSQLRMVWRPENGVDVSYTIPDGFEIRPMKYDEIEGWCAAETSLTGSPWTREEFIERMLFNPPLTLSPRNIYCAYKLESGEMAASSAACLDGERRKGDLHMVSTKEEYKGLGLGKAVCAECVKRFLREGVREADLSTDDFRKPAIAIYLKLGFRPWLYEDDMRGRWVTVLNEMAWKKPVAAYTLDKAEESLYTPQ